VCCQIDVLEALYRLARQGILRQQHRALFAPDFLAALDALLQREPRGLDLSSELRKLLVLHNRQLGTRARCAVDTPVATSCHVTAASQPQQAAGCCVVTWQQALPAARHTLRAGLCTAPRCIVRYPKPAPLALPFPPLLPSPSCLTLCLMLSRGCTSVVPAVCTASRPSPCRSAALTGWRLQACGSTLGCAPWLWASWCQRTRTRTVSQIQS
jgi:hypothetical protein